MNDSLIEVFLSHIAVLTEWKEREMIGQYVPNDNGMRCISRFIQRLASSVAIYYLYLGAVWKVELIISVACSEQANWM
jgi:hypothetical protein